MSRAWPMESAKTAAQKPSGSVSPPLSVAQTVVVETCPVLAERESAALPPSVLVQANRLSGVSSASRFRCEPVRFVLNIVDLVIDSLAPQKEPCAFLV